MESKQVIRRQYLVTLEEEEAQNIRRFLNGLQESDYEMPFRRTHVTDPTQKADTVQAMADLRQSLELVPVADLVRDTPHS